MKLKSIATISLLVLIAVSLVYLVIEESRKSPQPLQQSEQYPTIDSRDTVSAVVDTSSTMTGAQRGKIIAYYFHRTTRCVSCQTIESYTYEVIHTKFTNELKSGILHWVTVNIEEEKNEHFVQDYQLVSQSVVLVELTNGKQTRWKNLQHVWDYLGAKEVFVHYIEDEVTSFMKAGS